MISRKLFVDSIDAIRYQLILDKKRSDSLAETWNLKDANFMYDNSILIYAILNMIGQYFDREELDHYCFVLDFGKCGEEYESPEQLYDRLSPKPDGRRYKIGKDNSFH